MFDYAFLDANLKELAVIYSKLDGKNHVRMHFTIDLSDCSSLEIM